MRYSHIFLKFCVIHFIILEILSMWVFRTEHLLLKIWYWFYLHSPYLLCIRSLSPIFQPCLRFLTAILLYILVSWHASVDTNFYFHFIVVSPFRSLHNLQMVSLLFISCCYCICCRDLTKLTPFSREEENVISLKEFSLCLLIKRIFRSACYFYVCHVVKRM